MKVYVVVIENKPYVYSSKGELLTQLRALKLPFTPDIHECEVQKRDYRRKTAGTVAAVASTVGASLERLSKH